MGPGHRNEERKSSNPGEQYVSFTRFHSFVPNEPVEKVTFLKNASSAGSKIGNCFLSSKVFTTRGTMSVFL